MIDTCCTHGYDVKKGIGKGIVDFATSLLGRIFSGKEKRIIIPETMIETATTLWQSAQAEWGKTENTTYASDSDKWLSGVHRNIYAFSAAKSHAQLLELRNAVFDVNGKTKSFTEFRESASKILDKYNELWLETEYQAVVRSTIMARQWLDIERDKDIYPYLKYVTAGDDRVRLSHQQLDGKVFPVDSPFWKLYYPPNGWLCRCTVKKLKQTDEISDLDAIMKIADESTPDYWKKNVGISDIFDKKNTTYFDNFPKRPLEAVADYGMQPASRIAKRANLPELTAEAVSVEEQSRISTLTDYDGLKVIKKPFNTNKTLLKYFDETVQSPDEVWTNNDQKIYAKFYKTDVLVIITDLEGNTLALEAMSYDTIEQYRKGILNFKR